MPNDPPDPFADSLREAERKNSAEQQATIVRLTAERDAIQKRLEAAAKVFRDQRTEIEHLRAKVTTATDTAAKLQRDSLDLKEVIKDRTWFLVIESEDDVRQVTVYNDGPAALNAHTKSTAKVAFLCSVIKGPLASIERLTKTWVQDKTA